MLVVLSGDEIVTMKCADYRGNRGGLFATIEVGQWNKKWRWYSREAGKTMLGTPEPEN